MNNTIFTLRIPEIGVLVHPKHPDTTFFTTSNILYHLFLLNFTFITVQKLTPYLAFLSLSFRVLLRRAQ